ncbi:MAG: hypothetical protein DWQ07_04055 [Chloroflexi bacterium]|nr:MAG: hypothetical protein DWQ07_04055 [Chloroflexota bacterium]MBL1193324.1 hypothetical protein [Chloroflexota bacterium]
MFSELHVYSEDSVLLEEVYDGANDEIIGNNVWVFRPDGTFDVRLGIEDEVIEFSGNYEGDDTGNGFFFFLDLDLDGEFDDEILVDMENDSFSFIEWNNDGAIYRYVLVE